MEKSVERRVLFTHIVDVGILNYLSPEPRHDKTKKVPVRPAKTQISLCIRPIWSESSLSAWT